MKIVMAKRFARKSRIAVFGKASVGKTHFGLSGPATVTFNVEGRLDAMTDTFGDIACIAYDPRTMIEQLLEAAEELHVGFPCNINKTGPVPSST